MDGWIVVLARLARWSSSDWSISAIGQYSFLAANHYR